MRIFLVCLLVFLGFFTLPNVLFAQSVDKLPVATEGQVTEAMEKIVPTRFDPSQLFYTLIRIKESINRFFKPSAAERARFDLVLGGKRLKEVSVLLNKGDIRNASKTMSRYSERLGKMVEQLEKARSQNQEVSSVVGEIADGLRVHEVLLFSIAQKSEGVNEYNFRENFDESLMQFKNAVIAIDNVQPGLRNRFRSITPNEENVEASPSPSPTTSERYFEASPSAKPRRIIY